MKTIVVGTDGSPSSLNAVAQAAELAAPLGATLHVACVVRLSSELTAGALVPMALPEAHDQESIDAGKGVAERAAEVARKAGATVEVHVLHGEASGALIELCDQIKADLLVVGSRGMTGAARFLLGSVPNRCAHHANCSVLIARTD